jgi:hypothetical protein
MGPRIEGWALPLLALPLSVVLLSCNGWHHARYSNDELVLCSKVAQACHEVDSECLSFLSAVGARSLPCREEYRARLAQGDSGVTARLAEACAAHGFLGHASCDALALQHKQALDYLKSSDTAATWTTMVVLSEHEAWSGELGPLIRARWRGEAAKRGVISGLESCYGQEWARIVYENTDRFRYLVPDLVRIAKANEHHDWLKAANAVTVLGLIGDRRAESYLLRVAETGHANAHLQDCAILALTALDGFASSPARKRLEAVARKTLFPEVRAFIQLALSEAEKERTTTGRRMWPPRSTLLRYPLQPPTTRAYTDLDLKLIGEADQARRSPSTFSHATWRAKAYRFTHRVSYRNRLPAEALSALRVWSSCMHDNPGSSVSSPEGDFEWIFAGAPEGSPGTIVYAWEPRTGALRTVAVLRGTVVRYRLFERGWILVRTDRRDLALHRSGRLELAQ